MTNLYQIFFVQGLSACLCGSHFRPPKGEADVIPFEPARHQRLVNRVQVRGNLILAGPYDIHASLARDYMQWVRRSGQTELALWDSNYSALPGRELTGVVTDPGAFYVRYRAQHLVRVDGLWTEYCTPEENIEPMLALLREHGVIPIAKT